MFRPVRNVHITQAKTIYGNKQLFCDTHLVFFPPKDAPAVLAILPFTTVSPDCATKRRSFCNKRTQANKKLVEQNSERENARERDLRGMASGEQLSQFDARAWKLRVVVTQWSTHERGSWRARKQV